MERLALIKKAVGLILLVLLLVPALLVKQPGMPPLLIMMFMPPFLLFTIPYLVASLYLLFSRRVRRADVIAILICAVLLLPSQVLSLPTPGFLLSYSTERKLTVYTENVTLEVVVLDPEGRPVVGLEVDLWTIEANPGPPDVGFAKTNESGVATFKISPGDYKVGFNLENFPEQFICPSWTPVTVSEGETNVKVIKLSYKGG